jgi:hypothetical protein
VSVEASRSDRASASGWRRYQPLLVTVLVVVLLTGVALVLAQSAGAIHLPLLGSNGAALS